MAYNQELERRLDAALLIFPKPVQTKISKKKMFGGLAYLYAGKMTVGVNKEDLMVRIVSGKMEKSLEQPGVRPMDFTNRPMKEFVFVSPEAYSSESQLEQWISFGLEHAQKALKEI